MRRARVEVSSEDHRGVARPGEGVRGRAGGVLLGLLLGPDLGVEVAHPGVAEPDAVDDAALGLGAQHGELVVFARTVTAHEDGVAAAAVGLDEVRPALRDPLAQRQERVARGQRKVRVGVAVARELRRPPRRAFLQERDVPLPRGERRAERRVEVAARGRHRAAVVEVPAEDEHGSLSFPS
jgi:hypothetical protein